MQSFNTLIWPTQLQLSNKEALKYAKISEINRFFGRLISVTRNTSIALAIIYYLTYNYIIPNINKISKQRSALCIQHILNTRQLLKSLDDKIKLLNQSSVEKNLLSAIQVDNLNSNIFAFEKRIRKTQSSFNEDIKSLDNDVNVLTLKLNTHLHS